MQFSSILGLIGSFVIFIGSIYISTDQWKVFLNAPSIAIVLGGAFASSFVSFRGRYVFKSLLAALSTLKTQKITPKTLADDVKQFVEWSRIFSTSGFEGLKEETKGDVFLERCIYLAKQETYTEEEFREMGTDFIESDYHRKMVSSNILSRLGAISPAFGMVGTLVGLIVMLQSMGSNPGGIGSGMAVALVTTLYGVILAKMLFEPFANKIKEMLSIERFQRSLILEGFVLLFQKQNPYVIMDRLNCKLDPKHIYDFTADGSQSSSVAQGDDDE